MASLYSPTPTPLITADFNGDGHADLAFVSVTGSQNNSITPVYGTAVSVMIGNGDGTFAAPVNYANLQSSEYLAVGDFNGNGIPDLLTVTGTGGTLNTFTTLTGVGDGTFRDPLMLATGLPSTDSISGLIAADFNQDGRTDVAVGITTGGANPQVIAVFLNKGDGSFQNPGFYPLSNDFVGTFFFAAADLTGDEAPELVAASQTSKLQVFPANGDGTFQSAAYFFDKPVLGSPVSTVSNVATGDFNDNGVTDLIVAGSPVQIFHPVAAPFVRASITNATDPTVSTDEPIFTVIISNAAGAEPTSGIVVVSDTAVSPYYDIVSMSGPGWNCASSSNPGLNCTRADSLAPGASYPPITVNIAVPGSFPAGYTAANSATVSGGGSAATIVSDAPVVIGFQTECAFSFPQVPITVDPSGGTFSLPVTTQAGCVWEGQTFNDWIAISPPASGAGLGTLNFMVQANTGIASRTGSLMMDWPRGGLGGITVVQPHAGCDYQLNTSPITVTAGGGSFTVPVSAPADCAWAAGSNTSWISAASSTSSAATFTASANPDTMTRDGTVSIAGRTIAANQLAAATPTVNITSVTNAFGASPFLAPNTWAIIEGSNLAPDARTWQISDFVNNQMPTQLDNVSVTLNGQNAYVYYISPTQLNILTPLSLVSGISQVQVRNGGATSGLFSAPVEQLSPSFFVFNGGYVVGTHLDGTDVGPLSLYPGLTTPAKPGETVVLYANGFGPTSAPVSGGSPVQSGALLTVPKITIGGTASTVLFAGLIAPGLYQFNITVPSSAADGDNEIFALQIDPYGSENTTQAGYASWYRSNYRLNVFR